MSTPFIKSIYAPDVRGYKIGRPRSEQPSSISPTFLDAMEVRTAVFVNEQNVPAENELDREDSRSQHWVVYASVNKVVSQEKHADDGTVLEPQRSVTTTVPIGTLRAVPFPHPEAPLPGMKYVGGDQPPYFVVDPSALPGSSAVAARKTSLHNGAEPFVKLGRMAVISEFRGLNLGRLLLGTALQWLRDNPHMFNATLSAASLAVTAAGGDPQGIPPWSGLVHVHAQVDAVPFWKGAGFEKDEIMGTWLEEGIPHVGMFLRIELQKDAPYIPGR